MITFNIIQSYTYGSSQLIITQFKNLSIIQSITHDGSMVLVKKANIHLRGIFMGYIYSSTIYIAAPWIHMDPIHHKSTTNSIQILIDAEIPTKRHGASAVEVAPWPLHRDHLVPVLRGGQVEPPLF